MSWGQTVAEFPDDSEFPVEICTPMSLGVQPKPGAAIVTRAS